MVKRYVQVKEKKFEFELIDELNPLDNVVTISSTDYYFTYLTDSGRNKGGNSIILKLYECQNIDDDNVQYEEPDLILKICKTKRSLGNYIDKGEKRFEKEVSALLNCLENDFENVVKIFHSGTCKFFNPFKQRYDEYLFYTMEYAEYDLKKFIEANHIDFTIEEKVGLCISLAKGIEELRSLGYYHRDIKPDNIFMIDGVWKIGDLGLISERDEESEIDKIADFIGPKGWMSPEAMNKYLCEGKNFIYDFSCSIDHQSDIFQLGKVFWYVFQHNAPIGTVKQKDFRMSNSRIYPIVKTMLNHSKSKRYKHIGEVIKLLRPIENDLLKFAE